jgi:hypothetical protein
MPVHLTPEDLRDFRRLCRAHFKLDLDANQALDQAYRLIEFIDTTRRFDVRPNVNRPGAENEDNGGRTS